ncbi:MAG TPA: bifunctional diguanylate cyclase/phosphodiesterase [Crenotrichaceae bacterium]|nr:bifunctional diguanylate cyclase/phosphodiesterase [Crenotrichaceae bacterium]
MQRNDSHLKQNSQVFREQVAYLYRYAPLSLLFTVVNGFILAYVQRSVISHNVLTIWFLSLFLITIIRAVLVFSYRRAKSVSPTAVRQSITFWYITYIIGALAAGLVWASSALYLFPEQSLEHQMFVVFVLAGMSAAAVSVLAASMSAYFVFTLPVLIALAIKLFIVNTSFSIPMSLMTLFYLSVLSVSAKGMHRIIASSLMLRFDNRELMNEIFERQVAEDELFQQKERLQITFSAMAEGIITTSNDGSIEYLNPAAERMTGWTLSEVIDTNVEQVFPHIDKTTEVYSSSAIIACLQSSNQSKTNNVWLIKDGVKKVIEEVATPIKDRTGNITGAVAIIRDITQASKLSRQLAYKASHDNLTGLPNRTLLSDRLEHAINKAIRSNNLVVVLYMDLDNFKQINDSLGHAAGDHLLKSVAQRLCATIRSEDTVARIGGDEFVVILEGLSTQDQAAVVAEKIVENLATPISIENQEVSSRVSIGITVFPHDGNDAETLLKNADTAMYRTKELADTSIQFYTQEMSVYIDNKLKLEKQVQKAIDQKQLELYYQPRISIDTGAITGIEALVRLHASPDKLILPSEFIHIAEETGSIINIGKWVLQTACKQAQSWIQAGHHDLQISVNLSVRQILSQSLVDLISSVLKDTGLDAQRLELEITENVFLKDAEQAISVLKDLKALGVKLAIDDFGSVYSSLSYINRFPVDIIKIDKSFVDTITSESADMAVIPAIIAMGHGLHLEVIAEGVENKTQRLYLENIGCDSYQGYYFCKPLSARAMSTLLEDNLQRDHEQPQVQEKQAYE